MRVTNVAASLEDDATELSASIDGYRLWYRFPNTFAPRVNGNAFLVACLLPAMARGETLDLEPSATVCPQLLQNLDLIQDVFVAWGPVLRIPFRRIDIKANVATVDSKPHTVGSFFSGGVDGTYTLLRHRDEVSHLIFVKGIDMQLTNDHLYKEVWESNAEFARTIAKPIVPVSSNVRFFGRAHQCPWPAFFGSGLASIAHAIGLSKIFVASGMFYADLEPHGSHPLTDPLWSSASLAVEHDGADARRIEKLRSIAGFEPALKILRVCWQDKTYNCGRCEKCLRTMIQLRVLGVDAPTFPKLIDLQSVRRLRIWEDIELDFVRESLAIANQGHDTPLRNALKSCVWRNELRRLMRRTDEIAFSGRISKLREQLRAKLSSPKH